MMDEYPSDSGSEELMTIARYKEIFFGFGLGLGMWLIDATMHVQIGAHDTAWSDSFLKELFYPGPAQFFFRTLFLAIATFFGLVLWRSNQQQRQAQALERTVRGLHRGMTSPVMLILGYSKLLVKDPALSAHGSIRTMLQRIHENALKLQALTEEASAAEENVMAISATGPEVTYADKRRAS